jgi:hypothetical protein
MKITTLIAGFVWPLLLSSAFGQTKYLVTRIPGNEAVPVDMNNFGQSSVTTLPVTALVTLSFTHSVGFAI